MVGGSFGEFFTFPSNTDTLLSRRSSIKLGDILSYSIAIVFSQPVRRNHHDSLAHVFSLCDGYMYSFFIGSLDHLCPL